MPSFSPMFQSVINFDPCLYQHSSCCMFARENLTQQQTFTTYPHPLNASSRPSRDAVPTTLLPTRPATVRTPTSRGRCIRHFQLCRPIFHTVCRSRPVFTGHRIASQLPSNTQTRKVYVCCLLLYLVQLFVVVTCTVVCCCNQYSCLLL